MKQTELIMGMPIAVEVVDQQVTADDLKAVFAYFRTVDQTFSTYKKDSEISRLNRGELTADRLSSDVKEILQLAEDTKKETNGYFAIQTKNGIDPSGIVKGWAVYQASELLRKQKFTDFLIDAGGDIQAVGKNSNGKLWTIGIRHPFDADQIVKVIAVADKGVATSGTYQRGHHIYDPRDNNREVTSIASLTVIGPTIYDADRFATAAFAMGKKGIYFIENLPGYEGYMIDRKGKATSTTGFEQFVI